MTDSALGFRTLEDEVAGYEPPVEGTIPSWLDGTLIRNGPGLFDVGDRRVTHWFDGLAMLRRYAFEDGHLTYSNRFLRTDAYADAQSGRLTGQFATDTRGWRRLVDLFSPVRDLGGTDNANVHLAHVGDSYVALTEVPNPVAFDPTSLETRGPFSFGDDIQEAITTAHLAVDHHTGEAIGVGTDLGRQSTYHIFVLPPGRRERRLLATLPAPGPGYVHDCSITTEHVIVVTTPLVFSLAQAFNPHTNGPADLLEWDHDCGTTIHVVDRETGAVVAQPTLDPFFTFHHANAFCRAETVVLDLVTYPDDAIIEDLSLAALERDGFDAAPDGRLERFEIDCETGSVDRTRLYDGGGELPRVCRETVSRPHRYIYGQATHPPDGNGLVCVDCATGESTEWYEPGTYVEEPIPVTAPGTADPTDGVVLTPALNTNEGRTDMLVFDAETLTIQARAPLPHAEPFGFHGRYFKAL